MLGFWQRSYLPGIHFIVMTLLNLFGWRQKCTSLATVVLAKGSLKCCELLFGWCASLSLFTLWAWKTKQKASYGNYLYHFSTVALEVGGNEGWRNWRDKLRVLSFYLAAPDCGRGPWDLQSLLRHVGSSCPARDPTWAPTLRVRSVSHWTTRDVPMCPYFVTGFVSCACADVCVLSCSTVSDSLRPHGL